MEFTSMVGNEKYNFFYVGNKLFLVSGENKEYILYKTKDWHCADDIPFALLKAFRQAIDHQMQASAITL